MNKKFSVLREPWIPVVDEGLVSLSTIFGNPSLREIGGNPVQKIVIMKLLLAICQRAVTPRDDDDWRDIGVKGLADASWKYLESHEDDFWLHGEKPFLQVPAIKKAKATGYGALTPEVATGNTTVLFSSQVELDLSDAEKALLILQVNAMSLSGKQVDNSVTLSPGYTGKSNDKGRPSSGRVGPSLGHFGYQHCFLLGDCIQETLYMNLLTVADIASTGMFPEGSGVPPWEEPPQGEDDTIVQRLRRSYTGRLIPMSRFALDGSEGLHYSEGVHHPNHNEGVWDPSVSIAFGAEKSQAIWIDPNKRPWRQLPAVLAFITSNEHFVTYQIKLPYSRVTQEFSKIGLWVGGIRVSNNAGERYCAGTDDYVESSVTLATTYLGELWYVSLATEMDELDRLSRRLWGSVTAYYQQLKVQNVEKIQTVTSTFWQLCEQHFQELVDACAPGVDTQPVRKRFARHLYQTYDRNCPRDSARQIQSWARNRPSLGDYLTAVEPKKEAGIAQ